MCSHEKVERGSDGSVPLEVLEREICSLAAHIHSQTCRWLDLVAEYDEREGWAQWGCRSCAHWVALNCGITPGPAREHVRVARRLRELPLTREAFAAGRLSYSKVRAITRVENVERESDLVELARHATASQLERLMRSYRRVVATETAARGGRPERWVAWTQDDDGSVLIRAKLPAEEAATVIRALEAEVEAAYRESRAMVAGPDDGIRAAGRDGAGENGLAGVGGPGEGRVPAETPDRAADGFYAPLRHPEPEPPLSRGRVPAEAPEPTEGHRRADALLALADSYLATGPRARNNGDRHQVVVHVDAPTLAGADPAGRCELDDGAPLSHHTARRLACDGALVRLTEGGDGTALDVGRKTRAIPPALQRALSARDRGCRFPGCTASRFIDAHHIEHWADGGATRLGNLVQLCRHHHRLVHEGGFSVERDVDGVAFRRPDGRRIECAGPVLPVPPPRHRRDVDHRSCRSLSLGERLDMDLGVQALLTYAPLPTVEEAPGI